MEGKSGLWGTRGRTKLKQDWVPTVLEMERSARGIWFAQAATTLTLFSAMTGSIQGDMHLALQGQRASVPTSSFFLFVPFSLQT